MKKAVVKKSIILKGARNDTSALNVDGRNIELGRNHTMVSDSGLAREIEARHGMGRKGEVSKDVVVIEDVPMYAEEGHNYHFGSTRKYSANWERIFGNAAKEGKEQ